MAVIFSCAVEATCHLCSMPLECEITSIKALTEFGIYSWMVPLGRGVHSGYVHVCLIRGELGKHHFRCMDSAIEQVSECCGSADPRDSL